MWGLVMRSVQEEESTYVLQTAQGYWQEQAILQANWAIAAGVSTEEVTFQKLTIDQHFWIVSTLHTSVRKWTEIFNFANGSNPFSIL